MKYQENEHVPYNVEKIRKSGLGNSLQVKLNRKYPPLSTIDAVYKGNDITFITNEHGEPMLLYIGKRRPNGKIAGNLYGRRIKKRENGEIKESHWDNQGHTSGR